jgi:hypothetical protein
MWARWCQGEFGCKSKMQIAIGENSLIFFRRDHHWCQMPYRSIVGNFSECFTNNVQGCWNLRISELKSRKKKGFTTKNDWVSLLWRLPFPFWRWSFLNCCCPTYHKWYTVARSSPKFWPLYTNMFDCGELIQWSTTTIFWSRWPVYFSFPI